MADTASHLTHSFGRFILTHFLLNFSQTTPWRLLSLTSAFKHQITIILINKRSPKECTLQSARKIPSEGCVEEIPSSNEGDLS